MSRAGAPTGSGPGGPHHDQQHISFDFTVPSQGEEFLQNDQRSTDSHGRGYAPSQMANLRRKRSSSPPANEDDEEEGGGEEDEDDEYIPEGGGGHHRSYPSGSGNAAGSQRRGNGGGGGGLGMSSAPIDMDIRVGSSTHTGTFRVAQRKALPAVGPDGLPPPKKKRRRQALSCTGESSIRRFFCHPDLVSTFSCSVPSQSTNLIGPDCSRHSPIIPLISVNYTTLFFPRVLRIRSSHADHGHKRRSRELTPLKTATLARDSPP